MVLDMRKPVAACWRCGGGASGDGAMVTAAAAAAALARARTIAALLMVAVMAASCEGECRLEFMVFMVMVGIFFKVV